MSECPILGVEQLNNFFRPQPGRVERIGLEVECGLVDFELGESLNYHGCASGLALLEAILAHCGGEPVTEQENILGLVLPDGSVVSLEAGGALEYSSTPMDSLDKVVSATRSTIELIAQIAQELGIAVLSGAMLPFTSIRSIPWIPKRRLQIMRDYFARLGDEGSLADGAMGLSLSAQTTLDYLSEEDLIAKVRTLVAISPIMAALFANSPIESNRITGAQSRRLELWQKHDLRRCGILPFAVGQEFGVSDITRWAISHPMIYRSADGTFTAAPNAPFRELTNGKSASGVHVTLTDWESHLNQVWPEVRIRRTLEMRVADAPAWPDFGAVAAMWTGITYHRSSLHDAWSLMRMHSLRDLKLAAREVAVKGLCATIGADSVLELAQELVRLAERGLIARVRAGAEPPSVLRMLDPVKNVAESGTTFASRCAMRWLGELDENPAKYVAAYRI